MTRGVYDFDDYSPHQAYITQNVYCNLTEKAGYKHTPRKLSDPGDWVLVNGYTLFCIPIDAWIIGVQPGFHLWGARVGSFGAETALGHRGGQHGDRGWSSQIDTAARGYARLAQPWRWLDRLSFMPHVRIAPTSTLDDSRARHGSSFA